MSIIEQRKEALAQKILETIDVVTFAASLDPDESGYGQPHAYSPEFRELIREAKKLEDADNGDGPFIRVRIDAGQEPAEVDGDVDVYVDMPITGDESMDTAPNQRVMQFKLTYEGLIIDVFDDGMSVGTSSETYDEIHERLRSE